MTAPIVDRMGEFADYVSSLRGYEKGEGQLFCDRLFQAFGHRGLTEAGAFLEERVKKRRSRGTGFADLVWRPRVLIEMKSRGERLQRHYRQAFDYWAELVPDRPRYVVLCNFDEFWVYDFNTQMGEPVDRVRLEELPDRYTALNFLFPDDPKPLFGNDKVLVTREAAAKVARVFNELVKRNENRERSQRFILQCVVAMFAEDFGLLPRDFFTALLTECAEGASAYDLVGALFREMASETPARGGRFKEVPFFNGGLFDVVDPVDIGTAECKLLRDASSEKWSKVAPPIFGTLFQSSMDQDQRHAYGAHFTSEADIQEIVGPTIVAPWRERIENAKTLRELEQLSKDILRFRVLDPACGSGNFLYVAYRELVNLEMEILRKIHENFGEKARQRVGAYTLISTKQFFGIDRDPFAAELAKVTLMLAKRIAVAETLTSDFAEQQGLPLEFESPLPLDNLDDNIVADDALFCGWPKTDVIIGNPPYQSKNKMQKEFGPAYVNRMRAAYPGVPGRADYCVYWFRRAHDELTPGGRAGLVGTNTIRQNYSREGGLDYIVENGGSITQAWSSKVWSGEAAVHVSIVNWCKGAHEGRKLLFRQEGDARDSPLSKVELERISAALSGKFDVTKAKNLACNRSPKTTHQGQTHGHDAFLLSAEEAENMVRTDPPAGEVIAPFLTIDKLLEAIPPRVQRFVIDFYPRGLLSAQAYGAAFDVIRSSVLPARKSAAEEEEKRNAEALAANPKARVNRHHANFLKKWWCLSWPRGELMKTLGTMSRYVACGRVTKRPVFVFLPSSVHPNDLIQVFTLEDDYSFGVLQSGVHWDWFTERCSTLTERFRYTSSTVYNTFPWPQEPSSSHVEAVAKAAVDLRRTRNGLLSEHGISLRALYRSLELPGEHPLKVAHDVLNEAVRSAYGMKKRDDSVSFLFQLNEQVAEREARGECTTGPGLPPVVENPDKFVTADTALTWDGW